ncbi:DUF1292 domain-containing protein [Atopobacter sp. AH10]|nr:DUF1292 domain-containing protein [Atopobacter sp. AH10]
MEHTHDHEHDHGLEDNKDFITIIDENGDEQLHTILLTFESDDFGRSYVITYPSDAENDETVELSAFAYEEDEDGLQGTLMPIESDEEWDMVDEVLNTFMDDEQLNS